MAFRRIYLWLIIFALLAAVCVTVTTAQDERQPTAREMHAALNYWRMELGLSPLKANPTLEALAQLQLAYVLNLPNIPPNIHDGIMGEGPRERALWEPYNWPYYTIPSRINLEEITVAQHTVAAGIEWWRHSAIHNEAATKPNYREVGVAALPYENGTVFVAVLGGRPNVLPALVHPEDNMLYLTRETFTGFASTHISSEGEVRLLGENQQPLTEWEPWQRSLPLEEISDRVIFVELRDGEHSVLTKVDRDRDIVLLPDYLKPLVADDDEGDLPNPSTADISFAALTDNMLALHVGVEVPIYLTDFDFYSLRLRPGSPTTSFVDLIGLPYATPNVCYLFVVTDTPWYVPEQCVGQVLITHMTPEERFWYDASREELAKMLILNTRGRLLADCREDVAACKFTVRALPLDGGAAEALATKSIRLEYGPDDFTLINSGGQVLNISQLEISDGEHVFSTRAWNREFTGMIRQLPPGDCFQIALSGTRTPLKSPSCTLRHNWTTLRSDELFWVSGTFEVKLSGEVIGECATRDEVCSIDIP